MENNHNQQPQFVIQKIYVKDISFEAPNAPDIFKFKWQPKTKVDVNTNSLTIDSNTYEVELNLTIKVKNHNTNAYLIEISQAGIFTLQNIPENQISPMLGAFCPTTLFPYAREAIHSLINRGGFPQINLSPINFDALYMQKTTVKQSEEQIQH